MGNKEIYLYTTVLKDLRETGLLAIVIEILEYIVNINYNARYNFLKFFLI